jgi:hypothetical protein
MHKPFLAFQLRKNLLPAYESKLSDGAGVEQKSTVIRNRPVVAFLGEDEKVHWYSVRTSLSTVLA